MLCFLSNCQSPDIRYKKPDQKGKLRYSYLPRLSLSSKKRDLRHWIEHKTWQTFKPFYGILTFVCFKVVKMYRKFVI